MIALPYPLTGLNYDGPLPTPTRFKHAERLPLGTEVVVRYSRADPRNATVDRRSASVRRGVSHRVTGGIAVAVGVLLVVRGVLDAAG